MEYMLLIYESEKARGEMPEFQNGQMFGEYRAFTESIVKSGNYKAGAPLQPTATAPPCACGTERSPQRTGRSPKRGSNSAGTT
jgi:hypothetical protein